MSDVRTTMNELLEAAFQDMLKGATPDVRLAGEKRATELGRANYNVFAEFVVRHPDMDVRHAGVDVAARIGNPWS